MGTPRTSGTPAASTSGMTAASNIGRTSSTLRCHAIASTKIAHGTAPAGRARSMAASSPPRMSPRPCRQRRAYEIGRRMTGATNPTYSATRATKRTVAIDAPNPSAIQLANPLTNEPAPNAAHSSSTPQLHRHTRAAVLTVGHSDSGLSATDAGIIRHTCPPAEDSDEFAGHEIIRDLPHLAIAADAG